MALKLSIPFPQTKHQLRPRDWRAFAPRCIQNVAQQVNKFGP